MKKVKLFIGVSIAALFILAGCGQNNAGYENSETASKTNNDSLLKGDNSKVDLAELKAELRDISNRLSALTTSTESFKDDATDALKDLKDKLGDLKNNDLVDKDDNKADTITIAYPSEYSIKNLADQAENLKEKISDFDKDEDMQAKNQLTGEINDLSLKLQALIDDI